MNRFRFVLAVFLLFTLHNVVAFAEDDGSRPVNVAVTSDGNVVLTTSMGSTKVTQARYSGGSWTVSYIEVDAPSWGVVLLSSTVALVTHPGEQTLSVLTRANTSSNFSKNRDIDFVPNATEVIAKGSHSALVATHGLQASGAESWTDAVLKVDLTTDEIVANLVTERQPRALALSPDGNRLFVGTVEGAFSGTPLATNNSLADNRSGGNLGDGGSILVYDMTSSDDPLMPEGGERIGVGSPVRGIACSGNSDGTYSVYFTSLGDNANAEDPAESPDFFGGRQIPNVINELYYNSSNVLQSPGIIQAVFSHQPTWTPTTTFGAMDGLPAVLPDKIAVRDYTSGGTRTRELFVTNSGSGTLSRTPLDSSGHLQTSGSVSVDQAHLTTSLTISSPTSVSLPILQIIADSGGTTNVSHVDLSRSGQTQFSSNARAIAYNATSDRIWVATQLDNQILRVTPAAHSTTISLTLTIAAGVGEGSNGERNFFGFGRGFQFREADYSFHSDGDNQPTVGNQTCASCHVDGHSDGKVRITRRRADNMTTSNSPRKPVAVPSCFDTGHTEWLFFEGLRTTFDGRFSVDTACNYCDNAGFFDDTRNFVLGLDSPPSPYNPQETLSSNAVHGRYLFEARNCSRCHMASVEQFTRTTDATLAGTGQDAGPIAMSDLEANRNWMLNDLTQVFVTTSGTPADNASLRNMTDVGTRASGDGKKLGINTPALAGAWDNRPYMHDGRYRTLDEVLENTWLLNSDAYRAATLVEWDVTPDNAFDGNAHDPIAVGTAALTQFHTHSASSPGSGWTSVASLLTSTDYNDLQTFLLSLSSKTDPCSGEDPDYIRNLQSSGNTVTWSSPVTVECEVTWSGPTPFSETTTTGSSTNSGAAAGTYTVVVKPLVRPVCGAPDSDSTVVEISALMAGENRQTTLPSVTAMFASRPNPFNPTTTIAFALSKNAGVVLVVYDASGRSVRTLVNEHRRAGQYTEQWDGRDDRGSPVASGVYFCRMTAGSYRSTQKLVLLK